MSALNDQLQNLKEQLNEVWQNIQESQSYNSLREKYEVLPTSTQKALKVSLLVGLLLVLILIPLGYYQSSSSNIEEFNTQREQIRSLLKASNIAISRGSGSSFSTDALRGRIDTIVNGASLLESQIGEITEDNSQNTIKIGTDKVHVAGFKINLNSLNLTEITNIGYQLQSIDESVKLTSLRIRTNEKNDHYFDVNFVVKSFSLPLPKTTSNDEDNKNKPKRSRRGDSD